MRNVQTHEWVIHAIHYRHTSRAACQALTLLGPNRQGAEIIPGALLSRGNKHWMISVAILRLTCRQRQHIRGCCADKLSFHIDLTHSIFYNSQFPHTQSNYQPCYHSLSFSSKNGENDSTGPSAKFVDLAELTFCSVDRKSTKAKHLHNVFINTGFYHLF